MPSLRIDLRLRILSARYDFLNLDPVEQLAELFDKCVREPFPPAAPDAAPGPQAPTPDSATVENSAGVEVRADYAGLFEEFRATMNEKPDPSPEKKA